MDKRYQVFVSSTYMDLIEERQEVMQALLETDCIPAGMELFPASSDTQWDYITRVIDECDYYILILAGRYGSLSPDGISYTEKEYRYALEKGKPVIAFLHKEPEKIASGRSESTDEGKQKLVVFRKFAQEKLCRFYSSPQELGAVVSRSISQLKKTHPAVGWVKSNSVISGDSAEEILRLRKQIDELNETLAESKKNNISAIENAYSQEITLETNTLVMSSDDKPLYTITPDVLAEFKDFVRFILPYFFEILNIDEIQKKVRDFTYFNGLIFAFVQVEKGERVRVEVLRRSIIRIIIKLKNLNLIYEYQGSYGLTDLGEQLIATDLS
jgi:hypothetical protein